MIHLHARILTMFRVCLLSSTSQNWRAVGAALLIGASDWCHIGEPPPVSLELASRHTFAYSESNYSTLALDLCFLETILQVVTKVGGFCRSQAVRFIEGTKRTPHPGPRFRSRTARRGVSSRRGSTGPSRNPSGFTPIRRGLLAEIATASILPTKVGI